MTDDIQKVREAYEAAMEEAMGYCGDGPKYGEYYRNAFVQALAKRLQPRPEPVKKTWSVSKETAELLMPLSTTASVWARRIDAIAPDVIRERPDLVAAEWERRYRERYPRAAPHMTEHRNELFPELD